MKRVVLGVLALMLAAVMWFLAGKTFLIGDLFFYAGHWSDTPEAACEAAGIQTGEEVGLFFFDGDDVLFLSAPDEDHILCCPLRMQNGCYASCGRCYLCSRSAVEAGDEEPFHTECLWDEIGNHDGEVQCGLFFDQEIVEGFRGLCKVSSYPLSSGADLYVVLPPLVH